MAPKSAGGARSERLEARMTPEQKRVIAEAAQATGRSATDFVLSSAIAEAKRILREESVLTLSARDSAAFAEALLHPRKPGKRLREAAQRYLDASAVG